MAISDMEPKDVLRFFEQICGIPHGSYNTKALAEYCLDFARQRNLRSASDEAGNIAIWKEGSPGYENAPPLILQGHLDMVCEKKAGCPTDMETEGITLCTDGEMLWANQTTLGADDGIAIAMMLALLNSRSIPHPPLECLMTNNEEVGLQGAAGLSIKGLKGRRMINLDSETEGILTVSCAGAARYSAILPVNTEPAGDKKAFCITVSALRGGHSGINISEGRLNAIIFLGRMLNRLYFEGSLFTLAAFKSGGRPNVIPSRAEAVVCCQEEEAEAFCRAATALGEELRISMSGAEPELLITCEERAVPEKTADRKSTETLLFVLTNMPDGVLMMNPDVEGMVRTSLNTGSALLDTDTGQMEFKTMIRSNLNSETKEAEAGYVSFFRYFGGEAQKESEYFPWPYKADSPLRSLMIMAYQEIYHDKPKIEAIHAGLECGILSGPLGDPDMISIGPTMMNVHTPEERLSISSVGRTWQLVLKALELMR